MLSTYFILPSYAKARRTYKVSWILSVPRYLSSVGEPELRPLRQAVTSAHHRIRQHRMLQAQSNHHPYDPTYLTS